MAFCGEDGRYGYTGWECAAVEKKASMRQQRVGGSAQRGGFPAEMYGVRSSDYDRAEGIRKKCEGNHAKTLKILDLYAMILTRDIFQIPCSRLGGGQRPKGGKHMNKYELAVVVSAKIEDEERAAVIEKCKALIERFGGQITDVDEWGKKRLAYEIQKMKEAFFYFIHFDAESTVPIEIENRVRIMDNVIRYLCVRQDEA